MVGTLGCPPSFGLLLGPGLAFSLGALGLGVFGLGGFRVSVFRGVFRPLASVDTLDAFWLELRG